MIVSKGIEYIRKTCGAENDNITDQEILDFGINPTYHDIENEISSRVWEDYFYEYFKTDIIQNQNEYSFEMSSPTNEWVKKVISVEVKWDDISNYEMLLPLRANTNDRLSLNQLSSISIDSWFYDIKDSSIFLYPTPKTTVANWLKMQAIINLTDLTLSSIETDIFKWSTDLRQYHTLIYLWAKTYIYTRRQEFDNVAQSRNEYNIELNKMIQQLQTRYIWPIYQRTPLT